MTTSTIESKIDEILSNTNSAVEKDKEVNWDKILDRINYYTEKIVKVNTKFSQVNSELLSFIDDDERNAEIVLLHDKLLSLLRTSILFYNHFRKSKIYPGVKTVLKEFHNETENLKELIQDFDTINVLFKTDSEIQSLMKEIKKL